MDKLIDLLTEGNNFNTIAQILNISNVTLYSKIRDLQHHGYEIEKEYWSNGNIFYKINPEISPIQNKNKIEIKTGKYQKSLNAMIISDLHLGSNIERIDLLDKIYEYCAKKDISTIFNAGDIIDGMFGRAKKMHKNYPDQIRYALEKYPYDNRITTYAVLGNHDYDAYTKSKIDLKKVIESERNDIVPIGFGTGYIKIKNDYIQMNHKIDDLKPNKLDINPAIIINGHKHKLNILCRKSVCEITVPSLSNFNNPSTIYKNPSETLPGAIEMHIEFNKDYFKRLSLQQLCFFPGMASLNTVTHVYDNKTKKLAIH